MILTDDNFASIEAAVWRRDVLSPESPGNRFILPVNGESLTILVGVRWEPPCPFSLANSLVNMVSSGSDSAARL